MSKKNIYRMMKKRGISLKTLAQHCGISRPLLTYYFDHEHLITGRVARKISRGFKIIASDMIELASEFDLKYDVKK